MRAVIYALISEDDERAGIGPHPDPNLKPIHRRRARPLTASVGSTASWRPVDLGTNLRSEASASRTQSSATSGAGKRTGGGSRPFGYKIIRHDLGEGARRRYRIIGEEIEPAEADAIKEAATRVLRSSTAPPMIG